MRVIHFADLHIGVETYGRPLPDRPWTSRMQDFLDAFDEMVEFALSEGVDAVIFAGDAFKSREPGQTQQREFALRIRRLSDAGIATFLLVGNHDLPNAEGRATALEIYRTLDVPNVVVGDDTWFREQDIVPRVLQTRAGPLQVAFLPWPQLTRIVAASQAASAMSIEQVQALAEAEMTRIIAVQAAHIDPDVPSILTCHVSVNDFLVHENEASEKWMTIGSTPTLLKSALSAPSFDYVALGHHHRNMDLKLTTPTWYSGSMQRVDFGEEAHPKGFMVFDIDPKKARGSRIGGSGLPSLREVTARRFVTIEVTPRGDDPTIETLQAIEAAAVEDAIVRVVVKANHEQGLHFRQPEVRKALDAAHCVAGIRLELPGQERSILHAGAHPDATSPIETLELYFKSKQVEERRREQLVAAARDLILETDMAGVDA